MKIITCTHDRHAAEILAIFNEAIVTSTALFDYQPRTPAMMLAWFQAKAEGGFPVLGLEGADGRLLGFASYGTFRAWPAYKYSVENSVYVAAEARGQGVGLLLIWHGLSATESTRPRKVPFERTREHLLPADLNFVVQHMFPFRNCL